MHNIPPGQCDPYMPDKLCQNDVIFWKEGADHVHGPGRRRDRGDGDHHADAPYEHHLRGGVQHGAAQGHGHHVEHLLKVSHHLNIEKNILVTSEDEVNNPFLSLLEQKHRLPSTF